MRIVEHSDTRLVIAGKRTLFAAAMIVFVLLSAFLLVNLIIQSVDRLAIFTPIQWIGFVIWAALAGGLVVVGVWILNTNIHGVHCVFDRNHRVVTLRRPYRLTTKDEAWSINAIAGVEVTHNEELNIYAIWLILRSGERISLGSASPFEEENLQHISKTVREFLR